MASAEQIRVEILATAAQFREELDSAISKLAGPTGLKAAIKDVPNQVSTDFDMRTAPAHTKLGKLRDAIRDTKAQIDRDASFGLDTTVARLKLDALERKADQVKRKIAEDAALAVVGEGAQGAGGIGGALGGILSGIPGSGGGAGIGLVSAALPVIVAATGAVTALAGSLAAAAAGFAALAVGAAGVLSVGLGAILPVVIPAVKGLTEVTAATDKLKEAQQKYGAGSKQALQAQHDLNTVIGEAPAGTAQAASAIKELGDAWETLSRPAQGVFFKIVGEALGTLKTLLPTVASIAKTSLQAIDIGLKPVFAGLSSPAFRQVLLQLGHAFAELAPPTIAAFADIFHALANIAIAAAPFVVELARGFAEMTHSWVVSTSNASALHGTIGGLVGQLRAWWGLLKAVGGLLVTIFSGGASEGKGLVTTITEVLREWNAWLNTKQGQEDMKQFFHDAVELVKNLFEAFGPLLAAVGELAIDLVPVAKAFIWIAREIFVTDNIGKAFHGTVEALGGVLHWLLTSPLALLIPGLGQLIGAIRLVKGAVDLFGKAWTSVWHGIQVLFGDVLSFLLGGFSTLLGAIAEVLHAADINLPIVGHIFGTHLGDAAKSVEGAQHSIDSFRKSLQPAAETSKTKTAEIAEAHQAASKTIVTAWGDAFSATKKSIREINAEMLAELKTLNGGKVVPLSQGGPPLAPGLENQLEGRAGGGWIGSEGQRGRDEIPIVVGRGEAILHAGHQQIVNRALAKDGVPGGLSQVFKETGGLHYNMAAGGFAGGFRPAVASAEVLGGLGYQSNPIQSRGYSELSVPPSVANAGSALGHLPYRTPMRIKAGAREVVAAKQDIGAGSSFDPVMGLYPGTVADLGLSGGEFHVLIMRADGQPLTGGGGVGGPVAGVATARVKTPKWTGPGGAIGAVGKAAIAQAVKAANRKLAAAAPTAGGVTGSLAGPGGAPVADGSQPPGVSVPRAPWNPIPKPIDNWIVPILEWASHHGWHGTVISGYRSFAEQKQINAEGKFSAPAGFSNHERPNYPGGAVDLSNPSEMIAAMARYPSSPKLKGGVLGPIDPDHFSLLGNATGGFAGGAPMATAGFAGGRETTAKGPTAAAAKKPAKPKAPPKAKTPPAKHTKAKPFRWTKDPKFLPADVLAADKQITGWKEGAALKDTAYQHLLDSQALVPTEPLVELSDADVKFMDPDGKLGYQSGDKIVNPTGMTVGRFFGPAGIQGGKFIAGIDTRQGQIAARLGLLGEEDAELAAEDSTDEAQIAREEKAQLERHERAVRVRKTLAVIVARSAKIKTRLEALTTGDLKANLKAALSRKAIAERRDELQSHLRSLRVDLTAETAHQAKLIPADKEAGYGESLRAQITGVTEAVATESQLERDASAKGGVAKAREALLKNSLGHQVKLLASQVAAMGGSSAGTGGLLGRLSKEATELRKDQGGHIDDRKTLGETLYQHGLERGALEREQAALPGTSAIQVRGAGGIGDNTQMLLDLARQQLVTTQKELALSQAQFGVFKGFEPLLAGRLVGTFAHGVDRVSRTGPALVHQGEVILPDPDGPYGNRAAAQARGGGGIDGGKLEVVLAFNDHKLLKIVDARMNDKALRFVSDRSGQRSRLMAGVTHR